MKAETFAKPDGGDVDQGWAVLAVCWAFVTCAFISTLLRVWVRWKITRNIGADDWVIVAAMMTTLLGAGLITAEVLSGLGRHEYYLTPSQRSNLQALGWADWIQTFITLALMKISICLFLLRIVETHVVVRSMYAIIAFVTLFTAISVFLFLGVCRPLRSYWTVGVNGVCLSDRQLESVAIAQGTLSIVSDLILAILPIYFLRNLQISFRTKVGLCALMGLGVITAVCCTVRTALSGSMLDADLSWAITTNVGWRLPEVNIGIVCANAPILRSLYLFFQGRLASQKRSRTTAVSKGGTSWPSDTTRIEAMSPSLKNQMSDGGISLEMGLTDPDMTYGRDGQKALTFSPRDERPYFVG
ncbi:hypothetical protein ACLMJK_003876 [Lecanora helva]